VAHPRYFLPQSNDSSLEPCIAPSKHLDVLLRILRCLSMSGDPTAELRQYRAGLPHSSAYQIYKSGLALVSAVRKVDVPEEYG